MLGKKMTPLVFTEEEDKKIQEQLGTQDVPKAAPKSTDPVNFPVWEVLVNKKAFIYVPNHVFTDDKGEHLRMDKPLIHYLTDGKRYYSYRCINDLVSEAHGLTGRCPLCEGCSEPWDLANLKIEAKCKQAGLDPEDVDNQQVKNIRSAEFSDRAIKEPTRYYTFPIVVFETVNDDGKTLVKDEDGNYKYKCYWYNISESMYEDKWVKTLDAMEDEPTHPGGHFFLLNYCYTPKHGEPNKRDSARALQVNARNLSNTEKIRKYLDEQTKGWTPTKAQQTVINNQFYSTDQLQSLTDEILEPTRNLIAMMKAPVGKIKQGSEDGFNLEQKPEVPAQVEDNAIPLDETDDDYDLPVE